MNIKPIIYVAYCVASSKCYVGQTMNYYKRKRYHLSESFSGSNKLPKFYSALRLHGVDKFKWSTIICPSIDQLKEWEIYWSEKLNSIEDGYNCYKPGTEYGEEFRKKISKSHSGRMCSQEKKEKISKALKGRIISPEWREKISASKKGIKQSFETVLKKIGKKQSPEHVFRRASSQIGKKHSLEWSSKISVSLSGRKLSKEHRIKMSEVQYGRKHTNETKIRMAISQKARREKESELKKVA